MQKRCKYRFEVIYSTPETLKVLEFMKKMDLDIGQIGIKEEFIFTAIETDVQIIKDNIKNAFEISGGELLFIEGGKVE